MSAPAEVTVPGLEFKGRTVDLAPLFGWWTNHNGERPLTAWVHVTGTIVATNALGWTVRGVAESRADRSKEGNKSAASSHDLFILKNPPLQDQAKFEELRELNIRPQPASDRYGTGASPKNGCIFILPP